MDLLPLQDRLAGLSLGVSGTDLFVVEMPDSAAEAILLTQDLTGSEIDHELPRFRKGEFQAIVRSRDYETGKERIDLVVEGLTAVNEWIGARKYRYIRPRHEPVHYPTSKGDLLEFSVNFDACYDV